MKFSDIPGLSEIKQKLIRSAKEGKLLSRASEPLRNARSGPYYLVDRAGVSIRKIHRCIGAAARLSDRRATESRRYLSENPKRRRE